MICSCVIVSCIFLCAIYRFVIQKSPLQHIPGPNPLPLIGNVHQIDPKQPFLTFHKLFKKYGAVYRFQMFNEPVVLVNDFSTIYRVLVKQSADFLGRPTSFRLNMQSANQSAIAFTQAGPEWRGRRKVVHGYIKQYGTGMDRIEQVTTELLQDMVSEIHQQEGQPLDWKDQMCGLTLNVIAVFLSGQRIQDKNKMKLIHKAAYDIVKGLDVTPF